MGTGNQYIFTSSTFAFLPMLLLDSSRVFPVVITAHPSEPNQFALGLTDGGVHVMEPPESERNWGAAPPLENGAGPSSNSAAGSDQQER